MAGTFYCLECGENMGDALYCPNCGTHRLGDMAMSESEARAVLAKAARQLEKEHRKEAKKHRKESRLLISDFDAVLMGLYKDDKEYEDYLKTCIMLGIDE